jgi:hypothetical protein
VAAAGWLLCSGARRCRRGYRNTGAVVRRLTRYRGGSRSSALAGDQGVTPQIVWQASIGSAGPGLAPAIADRNHAAATSGAVVRVDPTKRRRLASMPTSSAA